MPTVTSLDEELAEAQYALNRALTKLDPEFVGHQGLVVARDHVWSLRQRLNPDLRG